MTDAGAALYRLMCWLSPAFPIGGFSYSHGIEYAVEAGLVHDASSAADWIGTVLADGAGRTDATLFAHGWRAARMADEKRLFAVAELAEAMRGSAELALESRAQGAAFIATVRAAWPDPRIDRLAEHCAATGLAPALPVAVAAVAAYHGIALRAALVAWGQSFAASMVSAAIRLVPLGQTDGQRITAGLEPVVMAAAAAGCVRPIEDIGAASPMVDWASMRHETQHTRLFRS